MSVAADGAPRGSAVLPVIFGIICFLGLAANAAVISTIVKKTKSHAKQTVPDIFILNLSVADLLFLLGMPFLIHQLLGNGTWHFGAVMCTVITALDSNSQIVSTYVLTAMTLDRYLATVHPIRSSGLRRPRVAALVIGLVWAASVLTILPVWLYAGLMALPDGSVACALLLPNPVPDTYWFTLYQFFLAFALPLAVICWVFFKILQHMSASVAPLPPRSLRLRTRKVTRMAVTICLAFFTCWAPYYVLQLVHLGVQKPSLAFSYAYNMAISMGYANSCINPLLYMIQSQTFRKQLLRAIHPVLRKGRVNPSSVRGGSVRVRMVPQQEEASAEMMPSKVDSE